MLAGVLAGGTACSEKLNYNDYISEKRDNIYLYSCDAFEFTLYTGAREQPYATDGVRGELNAFAEAHISFKDNPSSAEIYISGAGGEMNYDAVKKEYSLNFPEPDFSGESLGATVIADGKDYAFSADSVLYDGVMDCESALDCVREHARELFESLTRDGEFLGEISVRLLYDDGCYYYVGVCDRNSKINAYLLDGERGKIITQKQL